MFSTSVPVYLDHPNWNQEQQLDHQLQGYCGSQNYELELPLPPQAGGGGAPIKANSTADRARQAKLPQPEAGLKCPRCESANTKFCYFNNYNLSQPRHFCKTCRRYWTRGGSLRNIPVGGGCRKNKRCKNKSSSKSHHQAMNITNSASTSTPSRRSAETPNYFLTPSPQLQMPFTDGIQNCGGGNLGIGGFQPKIATEVGGGGGGGEACLGFQSGSSDFFSVGVAEQWRLPFLTGLESSRADFFLYQGHEDVEARSGNSINHLQAPVKLEENQLGLNLSSSDQFWGGNQWPEISGLNPSSTSNLP
ncbi:hypothetical protein RHGRI_002446 [Rhododendron griersonianum]|uniref:Dof zinc finger protein n=1 Tax=Rhododendron griersonianum TaxID=479676 RepID=A0AAV6LQ70_9ERIC|nr:hypothetical protein RHGRI_002446 [Rhododendron griersonianum]